MDVEHITPIAKLNLKLQVNETIVMHIHLSKGLYQSLHKQEIIQIMEINKWYLRIVLYY